MHIVDSDCAARMHRADRLRKLVGLALAMTTAAAASGCNQQLRPRVEPARFTHQSQAGTGHVAVLSVAPWEEIVSDLQPKFTLKPDEAFARAGATTAATERKLLDMLKVVAQIATPSTSTSIKRTVSSKTSTGAAGDVTRTSESGRDVTESEEPGELPEFSPSFPGDMAASKLPGIESFLGEKPEISTGAHTQYLLANALFQEVQLLNRYLEFAAVRNGYDAYVARLQVSLMPSVRNGPYDAYTTIGFFPADAQASTAPVDRGSQSKQLPVVIPLLVTDDMEAALASDSADVVRQYALALSAMIQGFALRSDVERYTDELVTTVTKDFNSIYQVARLGESSVRVRMGARLHSSGRYFMVPQTHNVTVLLLAPKTWTPRAEVSVEARTEFRHVETGEPLSPRDRDSTLPAMRDVLGLFGFKAHEVDDRDLERLRLAGSANDFPSFRQCVVKMWRSRAEKDGPDCSTCPDRPAPAQAYEEQTARRLWIALASIAVGGQYTSTALTLPPRCACALPRGISKEERGALAYGTEDGTGGLVVELRPVANIQEGKVGVRLLVGRLSEPAKAHRGELGESNVEIAVPADEVRLVRSAQMLRCRFPSLSRISAGTRPESAIHLLKQDPRYTVRLAIENRGLACDPCETCCPSGTTQYEVLVTYVRKEPPSADPMAKLTAMPALRACGCDGQSLTIDVARTAATPPGDVKVRLYFKFTSADGKQPASGVVKEAKAPEGHLDVPLGSDAKAKTTVTVRVEQLAADSVLQISTLKVMHGVDGKQDFDAAPADKASVLIFVTPEKCAPGGG